MTCSKIQKGHFEASWGGLKVYVHLSICNLTARFFGAGRKHQGAFEYGHSENRISSDVPPLVHLFSDDVIVTELFADEQLKFFLAHFVENFKAVRMRHFTVFKLLKDAHYYCSKTEHAREYAWGVPFL